MDAATAVDSIKPIDRAKFRRPMMTKVLHNVHLRRAQRRHAQAVVVLSVLGIVLTAGLLAWGPPVDGIDLGIFLVTTVLVGIGSTVGFHRHFTHTAFKATTPVRVALAVLGQMAMQGTVIFWVSLHRRHHECSDAAGDPHSPYVDDQGASHKSRLRGVWHSYMGWTFNHEVPNAMHYARDLIRDKAISRVNQQYFLCVFAGLLIPTVAGAVLHGTAVGALSGLVWGGFIRIFFWHNMIWYITSIAHVAGHRDFHSDDRSTNSLWFAIPTLGKSFHNNHHAFPRSALMGLKWWQVDIGGWVVLGLKKLGLAWDVWQPTAAMMEKKRVTG